MIDHGEVTALTTRQFQMLCWISAFIAENGFSPTTTEIGIGQNISTGSVFDMLAKLERKRAIRRTRGKARSIIVCDSL
jgi:SOS-response transcriptional repressor LexA